MPITSITTDMIRESDGSWGKRICLRVPGGTDSSELSAVESPITAVSFSGDSVASVSPS